MTVSLEAQKLGKTKMCWQKHCGVAWTGGLGDPLAPVEKQRHRAAETFADLEPDLELDLEPDVAPDVEPDVEPDQRALEVVASEPRQSRVRCSSVL